MSFQFKDQYYVLTDGLAMWLAVTITIPRLENTMLTQVDAENRPKSWFKYVDDVFSIIRRRAVDSNIN